MKSRQAGKHTTSQITFSYFALLNLKMLLHIGKLGTPFLVLFSDDDKKQVVALFWTESSGPRISKLIFPSVSYTNT